MTVSCQFPQKKDYWRNKEKEEKEEKEKVTRNIQLSRLGKLAQACLIFLVTFWNYPARSKDKVRKKKEEKEKTI